MKSLSIRSVYASPHNLLRACTKNESLFLSSITPKFRSDSTYTYWYLLNLSLKSYLMLMLIHTSSQYLSIVYPSHMALSLIQIENNQSVYCSEIVGQPRESNRFTLALEISSHPGNLWHKERLASRESFMWSTLSCLFCQSFSTYLSIRAENNTSYGDAEPSIGFTLDFFVCATMWSI